MRANTTDGRIGSVASRCIIGGPYCLDVTHPRLAEEAFVFAGKLSEALIAKPIAVLLPEIAQWR